MKQSEQIFRKYEYLAHFYANKLFYLETIAFEKDDIHQEFRIKLYKTLLAYGRVWSNYRKTGRHKPIPLLFYVKSSMSNFVYDFIKKIQSEKTKAVINKTSSGVELDYGIQNDNYSEIDYFSNKFILNGIDVCENLNKIEKRIYSLYIKGMSINELQELCKDKINVSSLISRQRKYLQTIKHKLIPEPQIEFTTISILAEN